MPVVAVLGARTEHGRAAQARAMISACYEDWLARQPHARLVLAPHSGHLVPFDDEDLLVDVVQDVVAEVRRSG